MTNKKKTVPRRLTSVNLYFYQHNALVKISETTGLPKSEIIRNSIDNYLFKLLNTINTFEIITNKELEELL